MFEFALSCGEGTLLDYGVTGPDYMCEMAAQFDYCYFDFIEDGYCVIYGQGEEPTLFFRAATPDCVTGQ